MRIAQIAPLIESVPPRTYGGTERVVSYLTEELVARGHDVTLFATGDSRTRARLVACAPVGLRFDPSCLDANIHHVLAIERFLALAHEFDVAHFHLDALHLPVARRLEVPSVTTLHGRLDLPDLAPLFREYDDAPLVSISDSQRRPHPDASWMATVHHGLPPELLRCGPGGGGYLAFLGRVSPEKGPLRAIEIARRVGLPLRAPQLAFMPLLYRPGITPSFRERYGPCIDGIVFHFRAESDPAGYIPGYDPKSFDMYAEVMRQEFSRVREVMGDKAVLAGIYIWYYKGGWGVMTPDGENPDEAHVVRDAVQKVVVAHQYADGIRIYGLGIDHPAYTGMGEQFRRWQEIGDPWGQAPPAPALGGADLSAAQPTPRPGEPAVPYLGTLVDRPGPLLNALVSATGWPRVELRDALVKGSFAPEAAVRALPVVLLSCSTMQRSWADALLSYARAGGLLLIEGVPGWRLDLAGDAPAEGEKTDGDGGPLTLAFAAASGVTFHYEPRGFVNRWRVTAQHPLTEGLGDGDAWADVPFPEGGNPYPHLAYNVAATDGQVLLEAEQERCPYDGVHYVRKGETLGVRPLLTIATLGAGQVVRHYAHVSLAEAMGQEAFGELLASLATWAQTRR